MVRILFPLLDRLLHNPVTIPPPTNGVAVTTAGYVGIGTTSPVQKLDIEGGFLRLDQLATLGDVYLCRNSVSRTIATCSSSLRYKKVVARLAGGLDIINRLRPIAFTWRQSGMRDVGFGAEEVEKVEPLLTFRNDKGEIEGVKHNQLSAVFVRVQTTAESD